MTPAADQTPEESLSLGWLDSLTRHRRIAFAMVGLVYLLAFNGIWRVGADSALYRGLARSLARGEGYVFAGEHHTHAFFGMPWLLAILEKLLGGSPVPGLIMVTLMALATLWLIERLIALRFPLWVATLVALGVGFNYRFVRQSNELMTDIPFALGVMAALYGLERLRLIVNDRGAMVRCGGLLFGGLLLAAATRPTFAVLALAIVVASVVRAITNRDGRRWLHVTIVGAALVVTVLLVMVDPRTVGSKPLTGVYEQELVERVQELPHTIAGQLDKFLGSNLNDAFFSQHMSPVAVPASLLVLAGTVLVLRRNLVWGLMIVALVLVTLPLSTVPRYYIMVMPFLWLGWLLLCARVTLWTPEAFRGAVMLVGVVTPLAMNIGRTAGFIIDQRRPDVARLLHRQDREQAFYSRYRGGIVLKQQRLAELVREHSAPGDRIVGPYAHVLAYFADRSVIGERTLFFEQKKSQYPNVLSKAGIDLVIFPHTQYGDADGSLRDLIRKRFIVAGPEQGRTDDARLARAEFRVPPPGQNWMTYRPPEPTTTAAARRKLTAAEKAALIEKRERKAERERRIRRELKKAKLEKQAKRERALKRERKERRERLERRQRQQRKLQRERNAASQNAVTQPSTRPAPATAPAVAPAVQSWGGMLIPRTTPLTRA